MGITWEKHVCRIAKDCGWSVCCFANPFDLKASPKFYSRRADLEHILPPELTIHLPPGLLAFARSVRGLLIRR